MEKLTVKCGRYLPSAEADGTAGVERRVERMEAYLVSLSEELVYLLGETERAVSATETALKELEAAVAALRGAENV